MPEVLKDIDTSLVTVGSPTEGGCAYISFAENPTMPKDASTKMSTLEGFESLGEVSEDGFTESKSVTSNTFKGWHGSTVLTQAQDEDHTFQIAFLEVSRPAVAKLRHGVNAVETGEDGSVSHIKPIVGTNITVSLVIDELESNGYLRRTIIPKATVNSFDDVSHQRGSLMVYGCTITAIDPGTGSPYEIFRAKPVANISAASEQAVSTAKK